MTNPLEALLLATAALNRFPPNSRYHGVETPTATLPAGQTVAYLKRRFCPQPGELGLLRTYRVGAGDRLDNLAAKLLGDPELFWRICDANGAVRPDELTETVGRMLRVPLPQGVPGVANAG